MKIKIGSLVKIPKNLSHTTHSLWSNSQKILETNHLIETNEFSVKIFTSRSSGWIKKEYCEIIL